MGFKEERLKSGLTQKMVAKTLGTSRVTISRWESGVNEPDLDTIRKLSRLYGCTTDDLLNPTLPSAAEPGAEGEEQRTA